MKNPNTPVLAQLGKLEMKNICGGLQEGPAPTTHVTENVDATSFLLIILDQEVHGDSYPDGCCD